MEALWNRLEKWQSNFETKMTREKYFKLCEQLNKEPDEDEIPPELSDFPADVQKAIIIFNKLGDRMYPDVGYLGKDYTQLPLYMDVYEVSNKQMFLEVLLLLDSKIIQKSQAAIKAANDKLRQKKS